jgi:hypothetical protein
MTTSRRMKPKPQARIEVLNSLFSLFDFNFFFLFLLQRRRLFFPLLYTFSFCRLYNIFSVSVVKFSRLFSNVLCFVCKRPCVSVPPSSLWFGLVPQLLCESSCLVELTNFLSAVFYRYTIV